MRVVVALLLTLLPILAPSVVGMAPSIPPAPVAPGVVAPVLAAPPAEHAGPAPATLRPGAISEAAGLRTLGHLDTRLPSSHDLAGRLPPTPVGTAIILAPARPGAGPSDLVVSGTTTDVVGSDLTVGNLTVQDNATLYVHGATTRVTLTIEGNVRVVGNALLFVNASNLLINEAYDVEWSIQVMGTSQFAVAYSNITTNGYQWGAAYQDQSNVTVVASLVAYPVGWLDTTLISSARLFVGFSWYRSDVILFDNAVAPSTANFTAGDSAGFNVWLNFKAGATANITLPGLLGWRNWSFPGPSVVTGVGYSVNISYSYVSVFAIMLWQGANLTVYNSPDIALSLNIEFGTVTLTGLSEAPYSSFTLNSGLFDLRLWNTTIFTWNIYPFAGNASISDSDIGEIQTFGSANADIYNSTLTAHGGYYGNQATGTLSIAASRIEGQFVGYSGRTYLTDCTVNTTGPNRILALGNGVIALHDTTVAPQDTLQALGHGSITTTWSVNVNLTRLGAPVATATQLVWQSVPVSNVGESYSTNPWGYSGFAALSQQLDGNASAPSGVWTNYTYDLQAASEHAIGWTTLQTPSGVVFLLLPLTDLVASMTPANGTTDVALGTHAFTIDFAFPMNPTVTDPGISSTIPAPLSASWDPLNEQVTVQFGGAGAPVLAANTTYTITVGTLATTQNGLSMLVPATFVFTTLPALPVPGVLSTTPANGSSNVSVNTSISIAFSLLMDPSSLTVTFSLSPSDAGTLTLSGTTASVLTVQPSAPLAYSTHYTASLAGNTTSAAGAPLGAPFTFGFTTQAAPSNTTVPPTSSSPAPGSSGSSLSWVLLAVGAIVVLAVVTALVLRRRRPPSTPVSPPPTAGAPSAPAPWAEELDAPPSR